MNITRRAFSQLLALSPIAAFAGTAKQDKAQGAHTERDEGCDASLNQHLWYRLPNTERFKRIASVDQLLRHEAHHDGYPYSLSFLSHLDIGDKSCIGDVMAWADSGEVIELVFETYDSPTTSTQFGFSGSLDRLEIGAASGGPAVKVEFGIRVHGAMTMAHYQTPIA